MKERKIFFILLLWCVISHKIGYASSEGVYIHDESSVVFHTQNFQIFEKGKPVKSVENKIEISSKKKSIVEHSIKKIRKSDRIHLINKTLNLPKEIKESVKYVKNSKKINLSFISNEKNTLHYFGLSPFVPVQKSPKPLFLQAKEPFFIVKKTTNLLFQGVIRSKEVFEYLIYLISLSTSLFFYSHIREKSKSVAYMLKRGPPYNYES